MTCQLVLLRHAKSNSNQPGVTDHERWLSARGERDATVAGLQLSEAGIKIDFIISSTARRARSTAKRVARALAFRGDRWLNPELYCAPPERIIRELRAIPSRATCVLAVGHNPGWQAVASQLVRSPISFAPGAFVALELPIEDFSQLRIDTVCRSIVEWKPGD